MGQRLALIAIEQNDVAGFGLLLAQLQAQADALDLVGDLAPFQGVSRPPPAELFFAVPQSLSGIIMRFDRAF